MQHDIYSAGVVLLEIGLWSSFACYPYQGHGINDKALAVPNDFLALFPHAEERDPRKRAFRNKEMLEELAESELPRRMGRKYTDVVLMCLGCLDEEELGIYSNSGIGVVGDDEEGVMIGVRFVENILEKARKISF
jgi:hypothetical protein